MVFSYYSDALAAERLRLCYELAPPRIQRYLEAEIDFIVASMGAGDSVLELGCGFGRVLARIGLATSVAVGIDISLASLVDGRRTLSCPLAGRLAQMNASAPAFRRAVFDLVCCPQNGISAFHVDQRDLIAASLGLLRPGGRAVFFSYSKEIWADRLEWFRVQAARGLVGEIDEVATGNGTIVCRDGFTATTVSEESFAQLTLGLGSRTAISTLDSGSVVCEITV